MRGLALGAGVLAAAWGGAATADETPKRGGTLTFVIPADAPPSFDGHREQTFATVQAFAPFYSLLIRVDPANPGSGQFVCDVCTEMPQPADGGKTYAFKIRGDVKFQDGTPMTAADVAASWNEIIFPPSGVISPRQSYFLMVDKVEAPDPTTVVFRLKFPTAAFLPALADPFAFIYKREIIDKDPHWYEKNVMGTGPFKFVEYETGQSIKGARNPDYFRKDQPYLDGFTGIFIAKQATSVDAIRSDRAAVEFRGMPPSSVDEIKSALGKDVSIQTSNWNVGSSMTFNHTKKPFDDPRVRRALSLAVDRWHGAEALSKVAIVKTVGTFAFPDSPLAPTKEELQKIAGYWPDMDKSRDEAKRLLKEAGAENLSFELLNRNVDQPYKYVGLLLIDSWRKIGVNVTQKVVPTGPYYDALRNGDFTVAVEAPGHGIVNPLLDVQKELSHSISAENNGQYEDPEAADIYNRMLRESDPQKQHQLMLEFEKRNADTQAHQPFIVWWYRTVPYHSYVKGWKIGPSHLANQDLSTVWLDK
ncbi:MAG: ABC transporter substrate-binding protein [Alphaproteobacteria bacterium]|nr:ABC transporter substrate-binding protein [Alphaproteobacteria bacterium]